MKNRIKHMVAIYLAFFMILNCGIYVNAEANVESNSKDAENLTAIMGSSTVTIGQLVNYFQARYTYPDYYADTEAPNLYEFCKIYMEECVAEGVRVEVAFCQSMKETGFLRYPGDVTPDQYNFAGIDTTGRQADGTVNKGRSYPSVRIGIRAHIQRLKAYAVKGTTAQSYKYACIDADKFDKPWWPKTIVGSAPYVEWLGKSQNPSGYGWATDPEYGYSIIDDYMNKLVATSTLTTWYQGVDYSRIYNPDDYLLNNPDIANAFGNDGERVIEHFVRYGMGEGRIASSKFSVVSYRNQYADLRRAFGKNLRAYYIHYLRYGYAEGRAGTGCTTVQNPITEYQGIDYSAIYDNNYYISKYPDIKSASGNDDLATLEHFVKYGMSEARQGTQSFSVTSYRNQYSDLRQAFGVNLKQYYLHYLNYGKKEGRTGTGCANLQNPVTIYNGVDYSSIYDYSYYINQHGDIKKAFAGDDIAALEHFVKYGMCEARQASSEFNVWIYKNRYTDLQNAFGTDMKAYYLHYSRYGKNEGRTAN